MNIEGSIKVCFLFLSRSQKRLYKRLEWERFMKGNEKITVQSLFDNVEAM